MVMPIRDLKPDGAAGADTVGGRRPTAVSAPAAAAPELSDRPRRRTFTGQDKLRILAEIDHAPADGGAAVCGGVIDLRKNPQLVLPGERPSARPIRQFGSRRRWGRHGGRPPASYRVGPSGAIRLQVSDWHNHVISVGTCQRF